MPTGLVTPAGKPLRVLARLGDGGEGTVYAVEHGRVLKLYHPGRLTEARQRKLARLVRVPLREPSVCWPEELVLDHDRSLAGYVMPQAIGGELQTSVFIKPRLLQTFPSWSRRDLCTLAISVLDAYARVHAAGALVGDINPRNVLVDKADRVFLVDLDGCQIDGIPCPVGTAPFIAPELTGQQLCTLLRTPEHEHFALATMVFMILMPGKQPYSHEGGSDPVTNVRDGHFPYSLGSDRRRGAPRGPWRFIWSHLPFIVKEAFHDAFVGGDRSRSAAAWSDLMRRYRGMIDVGHASDALFPDGFKTLSAHAARRYGGTVEPCDHCGRPRGVLPGRDDAGLGLCGDCNSARREVTCHRCGESCDIPLRRWLELGGRPATCMECRPHEHVRSCRECGSEFRITPGEQRFYEDRGLSIPRRCKVCRDARRGLKLMR